MTEQSKRVLLMQIDMLNELLVKLHADLISSLDDEAGTGGSCGSCTECGACKLKAKDAGAGCDLWAPEQDPEGGGGAF